MSAGKIQQSLEFVLRFIYISVQSSKVCKKKKKKNAGLLLKYYSSKYIHIMDLGLCKHQA